MGKGSYAVRKYIPVWICTHPTNKYEVCYLNIELAGKSLHYAQIAGNIIFCVKIIPI